MTETLEAVRHDSLALQLLEILFESAEQYFTSVTSMECLARFLPTQVNTDSTQRLHLFLGRKQHARTELLKNFHLTNHYLLKEFHKEIEIAGVDPAEETSDTFSRSQGL